MILNILFCLVLCLQFLFLKQLGLLLFQFFTESIYTPQSPSLIDFVFARLSLPGFIIFLLLAYLPQVELVNAIEE